MTLIFLGFFEAATEDGHVCKSLYCLYPENGLSLDAEWCKTAPPSARVQLGRVLLSLPLMLLRCACR